MVIVEIKKPAAHLNLRDVLTGFLRRAKMNQGRITFLLGNHVLLSLQ